MNFQKTYSLGFLIVFVFIFSLRAEQKLSGPNDNSHFGQSVAISGEWAVVGAPENDNSNGTDAGAVFIYHFNGSGWDSTQMIKAYGGNAGDNFGSSVAISGNFIVAGAPSRQNGAGAIYIFQYNGSTWSQQAVLVPSIIGIGDNFGVSIDIDGDYIIAGADQYNFASGIAFIYSRQSGVWQEQTQLQPDNLSYGWGFGKAVAIQGDAAAVGAPGRDNGFESTTGTAYLFRRSGSDWVEEEQFFPVALSGEQTSDDDQLGISVDIFQNYVILGAIGDDQNGPFSDTGAAYIFFFNGSSWQLQSKLKLSNHVNGDEFGRAVSIYGDYALVGVPRRDESGRNSGAVFAYLREDTSWVLKDTQTAADIDSLGYFGCAVAVDSIYSVIGSGFDARGDSSAYQNAYVYHNENDLNLVHTVSALDQNLTSVSKFRLAQNYPNPFNPNTTIRYQLPARSKARKGSVNSYVELNVYDILGKKVAQLVSAFQSPGEYTIHWNAQNFPAGVYFYTLTTDKGFSKTRKMILLK
ncbi:MAG TPA: T9SS type A sorting domain-containing protein [Caldithrix abyssi]|uniref:T9SS type A sorting domain-containing protein n=1 Tax=Caldithrix abyssi TaxID=187145 RepID=A0A7V4U2L2_CALAY|nr:T9SS type A sorting domain-containing protein [Caldithrix abyssi]